MQKNASTGKVEVASAVYRVRVVETDAGCSLFPAGAAPRNTFCYVAVDPLRHLCKVWFHVFFPFW